MRGGGGNLRLNRQSKYEYPPVKVKQDRLSLQHVYQNIGFEELLQLPLYAENQEQLNTAFSWIAPFEFLNGDVVSFYLSADTYHERYNNPNVFQVKAFNPPILPDAPDKGAKPVTLATIAIDFLKHLYVQERLFAQNFGK